MSYARFEDLGCGPEKEEVIEGFNHPEKSRENVDKKCKNDCSIFLIPADKKGCHRQCVKDRGFNYEQRSKYL